MPESVARSISSTLPRSIAAVIDGFAYFEDRFERIQALIEIAERFEEVPAHVAVRPFDTSCRVAGCESEAYVFHSRREDGTLDFFFAVENPNGVTARALVVVLGESLSGAPLTEVATLDPKSILEMFGAELSLGKKQGLGGIIDSVKAAASRELARKGEVR